jgi:hypothetical protein
VHLLLMHLISDNTTYSGGNMFVMFTCHGTIFPSPSIDRQFRLFHWSDPVSVHAFSPHLSIF